MLSLSVLDTVTSRLGRGTIATILAVILFGMGHIYLGQFRRGIAILTIGIGLVLIAYPGFIGIQYISGIDMQAITRSTVVNISLFAVGLGSIGFWIWQILDARKLARQQIAEA